MSPVDVEDILWKCVMDADRQSDRNAVTSTVFTYLLHRLRTVPHLTTGDAIVELEKRFRKAKANTWCIARKTVSPYVSCTFAKEPTLYHLYLVVDTKARAKKQLAKHGWSSAAQNEQHLKQCGFLDNAEEAAIKERRMQAVRLPDDLEPVDATQGAIFDADSLSYYAKNEKEATEILEKCKAHSVSARRGEYSDILAQTGVQVARTTVPVEMWTQTAHAMDRQIRQRLPIAESTEENKNTKRDDNVRCVREQLIPIGYQLLGYTSKDELVVGKSLPSEQSKSEKQDDNDNESGDTENDVDKDIQNENGRSESDTPSKCALFDLYAITERKYHVQFSALQYEWVSDIIRNREFNQEKNVKRLQSLLLEITGVADPKEMAGINFENVRRHVHLQNRGPTPFWPRPQAHLFDNE